MLSSRRSLALYSLLGMLLCLCGLGIAVGPRFEPAPVAGRLGPHDSLLRHEGWAGLAGEVRDEHGPLVGARVRIKGQADASLTDASGRFRLPRLPGSAQRVTAWHEGYLIAGAPGDQKPLTLSLRPLPAEDCEDYDWVGPQPDAARPQNCGNCHRAIYEEWSRSGHARSLSGRRFRNLYEGSDWEGHQGVGWGLVQDNPDGAAVCVSCHAPTARLSPSFDLLDVRGLAARGVHCDYCHKVADAGLGDLGLTHGAQGMKLLRPAVGQLFLGPLDDVDRQEDSYSPLYRSSRYCASCHEGIVFGVHVYSTYSEWLASPARREGKQCQTCHMAPTGKLTNFAPGMGGTERDPHTLGNHRFFAGSQEEMLRRALTVEIRANRGETAVLAQVEVRADNVGHRAPTGFVDRHLLLVVEGLDGGGKPMRARQGPLLPAVAGARLAGQPGRLYAKLLTDDKGLAVPFWRAERGPEDTRLVPGESDLSGYIFPLGVVHIRVRLLYRRFWQEVADTKHWPDNEIVVLEKMQAVASPR